MYRPKASYILSVLLMAAVLLSACSGASLTGRNAGSQTPTPGPTPVTEAKRIVAEGRLMPGDSLKLSFLAGGRVQELLVEEGGAVAEGQVIARLSGAEQLQTSIQAAQLELLAATQDIDSLNENYAQSLADAQLAMAQAKIALDDAQDDRESLVYRRASDATLNGLRADVILSQEQLDKAQDFYDHVSGGSDELVIAQALSSLSAAQKARDRAEYNLIYASELPDQNEIDKADANLMVAKAKVESVRLQLERLSGGPDSKALALAEARKQSAEAALNARQSDLTNLELKAPFSGTVVDLNISVGEQVSPGQSIATLADFSRWIVETTDLTEINIAQVQVGQPATLVADALPEVTFTGKVERISDVYQDKQGDVTYTVRVALDKGDSRLRWGMTFMVDIPRGSEVAEQAQPQAAQPAEVKAEPTAAPAEEVSAGSAEETVKAYFDALEKKDPQGAASRLSNYSMVAERTSREEVAGLLQSRMVRGNGWSSLEMKESKPLDDGTTLVHVLYKLSARDEKTGETTEQQQDEWWPIRLENGQWLYNWNNVIAYRALDIAAQSTAGLALNPTQITRYPDRLSLVLFAQNRTNETIVLGQSNEALATFYFGGKTMEAEKTQLVLERQQTYPALRIDVKGDISGYPDKVEIRKWKNFQTAPWFTFTLPPTGE